MQELPAIYTQEPPRRRHNGEAEGGPVTVYRLNAMTQEELERYGLTRYKDASKPSGATQAPYSDDRP
ncbi:hypothetical protein [Indiicoccus explosivorum]|uniref:hypothetical protein n=1 Tax=Indiicoccus explosivorum TaxID=1917864 RepID=UPI000B434DDE|nr:hypothetical protein [Indiicoccus explosivorum]